MKELDLTRPEAAQGISLEQDGAAALDDDALAAVSGGTSLPHAIADFNLNRWIGKLLREVMKKNSEKNKNQL